MEEGRDRQVLSTAAGRQNSTSHRVRPGRQLQGTDESCVLIGQGDIVVKDSDPETRDSRFKTASLELCSGVLLNQCFYMVLKLVFNH